jgi:hypothetical protein
VALARRAPELLLTVLFVALVAPVIVSGGGGPAGYTDEQRYHLRTVLEQAQELPSPDLDDLHTATTPGFHLVLAVVARLVTDDRAALEAFGALFSLALVLVAYGLIRRYADPWLALLLTLPLMLSHYFLQSAAWLNTDNASALFILLTLGVALRLPETGRGYLRGGAYVFLAVWVRQVALWAAGPFVFAAALVGGRAPGRTVLRALAAVLPAIASLAILASVWGQLTPPYYATQSGTSLAALPFTLALVGVFGPFFAACVPGLRDLLRGRAPLLAAGAALVLSAAAPTSETSELQRRTGGGLWRVVQDTPVVADRSVLIAVLAALGAVVLVVLWRAAVRSAMQRPAAIVLVAVLSLALAQAGTVRTYQRYFEPMLLVLLALLVTLGPLDRRRTMVLIGALCALQLLGCVTVVYSAAL